MVVAMVAVRVMQMPVDEVVHVVPVGHGFMPTVGSMHVVTGMGAALVFGGAVRWIGCVYRERVFVHMVVMDMVQVAVVEVVDVPIMLDGGVSAAFAVNMLVGLVLFAVAHGSLPSSVFQHFNIC